MNTDLKHYLYFALCTAGRVLFSMLAMAILARFLDPSGLGRWTMLVAAATLLHSLFANWLQQDPFLRFGKQEWVQSHSLKHIWSVRLPLLAIGATLSLIAFTLAWPWLRHFFQLSQTDGLLAFGYFVTLVISVDVQTVLQITGRMDRLALGPTLIAAASVPLYFVLWRSQLPAYRVEASLFGTILLTVVIWLAVSVSDLRKTRFGFSQWRGDLATSLLRYAYPILPTTILGYLVNWGNQVLIHQSFSNQEVGLYQSAFQVHGLLVSLAVPFTTILVPRLIDRHLEDPLSITRFVQTIAPTVFCLWLLAVIPAVALLPWVFIHVYGASFSNGLLPLTALLAGTPFCALGQLYTGLYTVQGKLGTIFWLTVLMVSINFLGAWVLVPHARITIQTVALAFSVSFIVIQFLVFYYQQRSLHLPSARMNTLIGVLLIFSIIESVIAPIGFRIVWCFSALVAMISLIRVSHLVDGEVLKHLFSGRLERLGQGLDQILVANRRVMPGSPS